MERQQRISLPVRANIELSCCKPALGFRQSFEIASLDFVKHIIGERGLRPRVAITVALYPIAGGATVTSRRGREEAKSRSMALVFSTLLHTARTVCRIYKVRCYSAESLDTEPSLQHMTDLYNALHSNALHDARCRLLSHLDRLSYPSLSPWAEPWHFESSVQKYKMGGRCRPEDAWPESHVISTDQ